MKENGGRVYIYLYTTERDEFTRKRRYVAAYPVLTIVGVIIATTATKLQGH